MDKRKEEIQIESEEDNNSSLNVSYEDNSYNSKNEKNIFSNDSEYPLNKNISPDLFTGNFEQLNNNFNDDLSESGYINRNFDTNFDEIYESLTYYVSAEKNKTKIEKENLKREINQFLDFRDEEITKLEKEKLKYENNLNISNSIINNTELLDLDIGGTYKITTTKQTLQKYPNSTLSLLFNDKSKLQIYNGRIFIDRDGQSFMNLIFYLRNNKIPLFENEKEKKNFFDELEYWQIPYKNKEKKKSKITFDPNWCAQTLQIESSLIKLYKNNIQHGIVFCKPNLDENNSYVEFKITIKTLCRNKSHLFIGLVDKKKYDLSKLISTFWKDSPSSFYWDTWTTKLIKTDDKGCQVGSICGYGCQCQSNETFLAMKYNYSDKTLTYFKNGVNLGVAFRNVPSGLTPSLDIWFEEGYVEIMGKGDYEEVKFL